MGVSVIPSSDVNGHLSEDTCTKEDTYELTSTWRGNDISTKKGIQQRVEKEVITKSLDSERDVFGSTSAVHVT